MSAHPHRKLFLLDAMALIYRAYYGLGSNFLYNSKGMNTTAISVFTDSLMKMLNEEKPTHIAVAFDSLAPTQRDAVYAEYKANRQAIPEDIKNSIPWIKEILKALKIPILEFEGYEADDIIGTIAKKAEKKGFEVYMVTPDKDFGQLVTDKIKIYKPSFRGKPPEILGQKEIQEKWQIDDVKKVTDILGLMGDSVDNIPGIKGIGEKTAIKLIQEFGSLENLLAHTGKLTGRLKENVEQHADEARLSKQLATIVTDLPIEVDEESFALSDPDRQKLAAIFAELEFRTLGKRILGESYSPNREVNPPLSEARVLVEEQPILRGRNIHNTTHRYVLAGNQALLDELTDKLAQAHLVSLKVETDGDDVHNSKITGLSFVFKPQEGYYLPVKTEIPAPVVQALRKRELAKTGHDLKPGILVLRHAGIELEGDLFDTMIAHYVIDGDARHRLDLLSENYLGYTLLEVDEQQKKKTQELFPDAERIKDRSVEAADVALQLQKKFEPIVSEPHCHKLFYEVEIPLIRVLADMEFEGIALDVPFLERYSAEMEKDIHKLKEEIFREAGCEFNLESPKQLGEVLFEKMKIPYEGKKTKTGQYSTGEEILTSIQKEYPIAGKILEYRGLVKLKSTYVDALPQHVHPRTQRVHTTFNQAVAATGRLSSTNPNLQNIPIKTERGSEIRKAFIPRDRQHVLLSADYSQIELRLVAAMSKDENLLQAFKDGLDVHAATASRLYNVPLEMVTREMRSNAKMVNFGLMYGMSAFGLAQRTGMTRSEAAAIIQQYFTQFPGIKRFMDEAIEKARKQGYAETIMGRRRYLPDINSKNATVRGFAERNAINTPIQGSAADMIKIAMIRIHRQFEKKKLRSKMILQIHDELVFDVRKEEVEEARAIIEEHMKNALPLEVPIVVDIGIGNNWLEAH